MTPRVKNLMIVLGILLLVLLGVYLYSQKSAVSLNVDAVDNSLAVDTSDFAQKLAQLDQINLDTSVFTDARFRSLVDFSEPINPQPVGHANPFVSN